jgi:hypothetical protein
MRSTYMKATRTVELVLAGLPFGACGAGQGAEPVPPSAPTRAIVFCGLQPHEVVAAREREARRAIEQRRCVPRVIARDGVSLALRQNLRCDRINIEVSAGIVTAARFDRGCP